MSIKSLLAVLVVLSVASLCGCGNSSSDDSETSAQPMVDPRFATLESTLQYYNSVTTRDPVDPAAVFQLVFAESDLQRRLLDIERQSKPLIELDRLMFERFKEGWLAGRKAPLDSPNQPAQLTKSDAHRGEGQYVDSEERTRPVHFVKVGDRWWVSGFTLEYDPEVRKNLEKIEVMERVMPAMAAAARNIKNYVQSRQVNSAAETRRVFFLWIMDKHPELKDDLAKLAGP